MTKGITIGVRAMPAVADALEEAAKMIAALQRKNAALQGIIDKNSAAFQILEGATVAFCPHCNKSIP